jgi:hypothetical protein
MEKKQSSISKDEIFKLIDITNQFHFNEDRLSSERTNIFLLLNSFLVAGYILSLSLENLIMISIILSSVGIIFSILQYFLIYFNLKALKARNKNRQKLIMHPLFHPILKEELISFKIRLDKGLSLNLIKWFKMDPHNIIKIWYPLVFFITWLCFLLISIYKDKIWFINLL